MLIPARSAGGGLTSFSTDLFVTGKKTLQWDGKRITNDEAANASLATTYRTGWELA